MPLLEICRRMTGGGMPMTPSRGQTGLATRCVSYLSMPIATGFIKAVSCLMDALEERTQLSSAAGIARPYAKQSWRWEYKVVNGSVQ